MKKTLIALAALAATSAFAQSTVTLSGQLDASYGKGIGSDQTVQSETHGSRVRLTGSEDLGGGLKANFNLEHRLTLKDGAANANFWNGVSTVGVSGAFGNVNVGRQYSAGFLSANNKADPFGGDGAGALRGVGMRTVTIKQAQGVLRTGSSIGYTNAFGPVSLHVTSGEALGAGATKRALGYAIGYAAGPLSVGFGTDTGSDNTQVSNMYAGYNFGVANVTFGTGSTGGSAAKTKGQLIAVAMPMGAGVFKAGFASAKNAAGVSTNSKMGVGYSHNLSKRTRIDLTAGNDSKVATQKSGYDATLTHSF